MRCRLTHCCCSFTEFGETRILLDGPQDDRYQSTARVCVIGRGCAQRGLLLLTPRNGRPSSRGWTLAPYVLSRKVLLHAGRLYPNVNLNAGTYRGGAGYACAAISSTNPGAKRDSILGIAQMAFSRSIVFRADTPLETRTPSTYCQSERGKPQENQRRRLRDCSYPVAAFGVWTLYQRRIRRLKPRHG